MEMSWSISHIFPDMYYPECYLWLCRITLKKKHLVHWNQDYISKSDVVKTGEYAWNKFK